MAVCWSSTDHDSMLDLVMAKAASCYTCERQHKDLSMHVTVSGTFTQ